MASRPAAWTSKESNRASSAYSAVTSPWTSPRCRYATCRAWRSRAAARWSPVSSLRCGISLTCSRGDRAELLHEPEVVLVHEHLYDLAVADREDVDPLVRDRVAAGGHPEERPLVGGCDRPAAGHLVALGNFAFDGEMDVGERIAQTGDERPEPIGATDGLGQRGDAEGEVGGDDLIDHTEVALVHDLVEVPGDDRPVLLGGGLRRQAVGSRDRAELHQQAQRVLVGKGLDDLAVLHTEPGHPIDPERPAAC